MQEVTLRLKFYPLHLRYLTDAPILKGEKWTYAGHGGDALSSLTAWEAKGDAALNVGDLFKLLQLYRTNLSLWEKGATEDQNCSGVFPGSASMCV